MLNYQQPDARGHFGPYGGTFVAETLMPALLDRLTHHCHIVETGNESWRFQHSSAAAKSRIQSREKSRRAAAAEIEGADPF